MNYIWLHRNKEFLVTGAVVLASLLFLGFFTESSTISPMLQSVIVSLAVFLALPIMYCKMILRRPLSDLGLQAGSIFAGIGGSLVALTSGLILLFILSRFTPFFHGTELPLSVERNFLYFLLYEVLLNGAITFMLEVYFRGFLMLQWLRRFGFLAVFVQAIIFVVLLYFANGINAQTIPMILFSPLAGLIAYQSRSILASWIASWFFLFLADVIFLIVR